VKIEAEQAEALTRRWLRDCVLALDLCPFAAGVVGDGSLRIACSDALTPQQCLRDFLGELDGILTASSAEISTTLLVYTTAVLEFDDFLDLLDTAQDLLEQAGLEGLFQLASFHPDYRFEGEAEDAASHYTNRSPYPTLHLLREDMMEQLLLGAPDAEQVPLRNIQRLQELGLAEVQRRWAPSRVD
jgi:hypothetical protein